MLTAPSRLTLTAINSPADNLLPLNTVMSSGETSIDSILYPDGDIKILKANGPVNAGGFGELFIGMHRTQGKLALKKLKGSGGNERQQRVSTMRMMPTEAAEH